jgi:NADH dehydrogenase [ubiquinone] 1 alpha subcomplex assembly factor 5
MEQTTIPQIFDTRRRRAVHDRAAFKRKNGSHCADVFLWQHMAENLTEQLAIISRTFTRALVIGPIGHYIQGILNGRDTEIQHAAFCEADAAALNCILVNDDSIPFAAHSHDLIIIAGILDSVNDLPGMLVQMRRILKPDGLLLAVLFGPGTLATLRGVLMRADGDRVMSHIHPQIDLRTAADLLSRTGFALPVADIDTINVRYSDWRILLQDLRDAGAGNVMAGGRAYCGKTWSARIDAAWAQLKQEDGKVAEQFVLLNLTAWSPSPDQPKPAPRGSGKVSLADALARKTD